MLKDLLDKAGYHSVRSIVPVSGGSINDCYHVSADKEQFFIKMRRSAMPPDMFLSEESGLNALRKASSELVIPSVKYVSEDLLVLEYLERHPEDPTPGEGCGRGLAGMHQVKFDNWGWGESNYIGTLTQNNPYQKDGTVFFIIHRLRSLLDRTAILNVDESLSEKKVRTYMQDHIDMSRVSLLHGDLWGGNAFRCADGRSAIFDPAVYYGHPEIDLSMTCLFGGFSSAFYGAYEEAAGINSSWRERVRFWNLYPLLVHAVLFGGTYVTDVRTTMDYFGFIKR